MNPDPVGPEAAPLRALPRLAADAVAVLGAAKLLLHVFTSVQRYGYFRDELYYLDMARHLDWGYVDCAPLIALYAKAALLLGGSLAALRILPALAGAGVVAITILIARELGGGRWAQWLAGFAALLSTGILLMSSLLTMNAFEPVFWMGAILVVARILRTGDSRLWVAFGVLAGLGLENKHSTLFFGFSVSAALLLTGHRREVGKRWIWIGGAVALSLFLPNLLWQIRHHFPTLEDLENVRRSGKNVVLGPLAFTKEQILDMNPVLFPLWLGGLAWFLSERRWRVLGLTFAVFFVTMEIAHAKNYYLFSIYPMLFAGGAAAFERWTSRKAWARAVAAAFVVLFSLPLLPLATWMLSPDRYLAYTRAIGFTPSKAEVHHVGPLPQPMGDQFGWPELVRQVADIYRALPPPEREQTGIWAGNYGEAGAVNLFGPEYGLPRAISRHQNHWYWPPDRTYRNFIVLQWDRKDVEDSCSSWQAFPHFHPWGMAEENVPIHLCRGATFDVQKIWWHSKHWN